MSDVLLWTLIAYLPARSLSIVTPLTVNVALPLTTLVSA